MVNVYVTYFPNLYYLMNFRLVSDHQLNATLNNGHPSCQELKKFITLITSWLLQRIIKKHTKGMYQVKLVQSCTHVSPNLACLPDYPCSLSSLSVSIMIHICVMHPFNSCPHPQHFLSVTTTFMSTFLYLLILLPLLLPTFVSHESYKQQHSHPPDIHATSF